MQPFAYASPTTLKGALTQLADRWGEADVLAGGTDLMSLMKEYLHTPARVIDITGIKELGGIRKTGAGLRIGALVTLEELIDHPLLRAEYPSLVTAAQGVASPQIRNLGTVAGDLCQRPRCWYFRAGYGLLAQDKDGGSIAPKGENRYHAILGNTGLAHFVSASSLGPPLIAFGARIGLASASGRREVEADKFFVIPGKPEVREIVLNPNEIVTEVWIPPTRGMRNATYEVRQKQALDWPLATASVALAMKGDTIATARVVLGHVAPVPWLATKANDLLAGKKLTPEIINEAAGAALAGATPLSQNAYKVALAKTAVKRALNLSIGNAHA